MACWLAGLGVGLLTDPPRRPQANGVIGQHKRSPHVRYRTVEDRVVIATKRPLPVQADGEIIGEPPVEVSVVPRALRVVVPRGAGAKARTPA